MPIFGHGLRASVLLPTFGKLEANQRSGITPSGFAWYCCSDWPPGGLRVLFSCLQYPIEFPSSVLLFLTPQHPSSSCKDIKAEDLPLTIEFILLPTCYHIPLENIPLGSILRKLLGCIALHRVRSLAVE